MKTTLHPDDLQFYRENGFLAVPEFLSPEELEDLRREVDKTVAEMGTRKVSVGRDDMRDDPTEKDREFTQKLNLWKLNPAIKRLVTDPDLGKLLCELSQVKGMRVWHDQALIKEPYSPPTNWHLDSPFWSFTSRQTISIWIALDDATWQNGCLYFVPGSQLITGDRNVGNGAKLGTLFDIYPELKKTPPVGVPIKAGSCTFHNGLTAHGAGANMTPGRRRAMTCAYIPDGSPFNGIQNILPKEYWSRLKIGDPLSDDTLNPLIYRS